MSTKKKTIKVEFTEEQLKSTLFVIDAGYQILKELAKVDKKMQNSKLKEHFAGVPDMLHEATHKLEGTTCESTLAAHIKAPKFGILNIKQYEADDDDL